MGYDLGMKCSFRKVLTVCLSLCFTTAISTTALAQADTSLHLTVANPVVSILVKPGAQYVLPIRVQNAGASTEKIRVGLMKFSAGSETGSPKLADVTNEDTFATWISFNIKTFDLQPQEWKTVFVTFTVPANAGFSYFPAIVFARDDVVDQESSSQLLLRGAAACLVLLGIDRPDAVRSLNLTSFTVDKQFYEYLPVTFSVRVANTGNTFILPRGNIFIDHGSVKGIANFIINNQHGSVLPNSTRAYTDSSWVDGFPAYTTSGGNGSTETKLNWDTSQASKIRFGKFTANLVLVYNDGTRDVPVEAHVDFWVIPWRLICGLVALLILSGLGVYFLMKKIFTGVKRLRRE